MGNDDLATERPGLVAIHDAHADFVWRSLQRLGVPPADLEDALQEVFVVVHQRLGTFRGSSKLTTWLFGITLRVASRFRRRPHVRREQSEEDLAHHAQADASAGPEAEALQREERALLLAVLDTLDPEKRVVLVMFELERIDATAIGEALGIPVGTVHSRLRAARAQFAKAATRLRMRRER